MATYRKLRTDFIDNDDEIQRLLKEIKQSENRIAQIKKTIKIEEDKITFNKTIISKKVNIDKDDYENKDDSVQPPTSMTRYARACATTRSCRFPTEDSEDSDDEENENKDDEEEQH